MLTNNKENILQSLYTARILLPLFMNYPLDAGPRCCATRAALLPTQQRQSPRAPTQHPALHLSHQHLLAINTAEGRPASALCKHIISVTYVQNLVTPQYTNRIFFFFYSLHSFIHNGYLYFKANQHYSCLLTPPP